MHRPRTAALGLIALVAVALVAIAMILPVPYVMLRPGPVADTLGSAAGKPLIRIEGEKTYPTSGQLDLTTVGVLGGPDRMLTAARAISGWLDGDVAVVPEASVYPPGQTQEQVQEENAELMTQSQETATAAALRETGHEVAVVVGRVVEGSPADGKLEVGDQIVAVDGESLETATDLRTLVRAKSPGDEVEITYRRGTGATAERGQVTLTAAPAPDDPERAFIGVSATYRFPFTVDIQLDNVGGPSAGLMFTLGIIDKLTPGPLTGGRHIAGTGTISDDDTVGPIGGIQQKVKAARADGATLFLTPELNCADAARVRPDGLLLAEVATLDDAIAAVEQYAADGTVPRECSVP